MNGRIRIGGLMGLIHGLLFAVAAAETPQFSLKLADINGVAVRPLGTSTIAYPGDLLTVEIRARCWSNGIPHKPGSLDTLKRFVATFDFSSFFNAPQSSGNVLPCQFFDTTDVHHQCPAPPIEGMFNHDCAFLDGSRLDYPFYGVFDGYLVFSRGCSYGYLGSYFPGGVANLCPFSKEAYFGTLILDVSADAAGTFTVCLDDSDIDPDIPGPDRSYLVPYAPGIINARILPLDFECLTIFVSVLGDADGDGDIDLDDHARFAECRSDPDTEPAPMPPLTSQGCLRAFDINNDRDIDLADFATFQLAVTRLP